MKIELYLPFPPSINSYYVKHRNGVFISKVGRTYRSGSLEKIAEVVGPITGQIPLLSPVSVTVVYYPKDKRKRDLDNYKKALYDVITHSGLWLDDSLVDQEFSYRGVLDPEKKGYCWVMIDTEAHPLIGSTDDKRKFGRDWLRE